MNDITIFFRKFIIIFILFIFSFSVLFAILKPKTKSVNSTENQNTHVKNLIINKNDFSPNIQPSTNFTENTNIKIEDTTELEKINLDTQKKDFQVNSKNDIKKEISPEINISSNNNLIEIQKELSEKYNNNPNAEVSDEDIVKYLNKVLENVQKK